MKIGIFVEFQIRFASNQVDIEAFCGKIHSNREKTLQNTYGHPMPKA